MASSVPEWVFTQPHTWSRLSAYQLQSDPPEGLSALGFIPGGQQGCWQEWWRMGGDCAYRFAILLQLDRSYELVWCPDLPDLISWLGQHGQIPILHT